MKKIQKKRELMTDTSFWLALADKRDQYQELATSLMHKIESSSLVLAITDYVIDESMTLITRRSDYQKALTFYDLVVRICKIYWIERSDLESCVDIFRTYKGGLTFTDAAIVQAMQKHGLKILLSFDKGFDRVPGLTRVHMPGQLQA